MFKRPSKDRNDETYLSEESIRSLQARLSRIEGHVRGVSRMLEEHRSCDDILTQVAGVRAALDQVAIKLLEGHLETCVAEAIRAGDGSQQIAMFKGSLARVLK